MKNIRNQDDTIDLLELFWVLWSKKTFILILTLSFMIFGLLIALTSRVEYEATCKVMPENNEGTKNSLGSLGNLAGLAGISLDLGTSGSLSPALYPQIVNSIPFQLDLIKSPLRFEKQDTVISSLLYLKTFKSINLLSLIKAYTVGLPGKIKNLFVKNEQFTSSSDFSIQEGMYRFSKQDWEIINAYRERTSISTDTKTGIITVTTLMPDAYAAAELTNLVVENLTNKITKYRTEKAQLNLAFINERYQDAEKNYKEKQQALARFVDRNLNLTSSLIQTEHQRLQNELNVALELYKSLATQLEQSKIKVEEETPVFTILEPVSIPVNKSKPQRTLIVIGFTMLGAFLGSTFIAVKNILRI